MMVALNESNNTSGLAKEIDLLKDLHILAFNKLPCKRGRQLSSHNQGISNHQVKISKSVLQILDTPSKTTDVVANKVVSKVLDTNCCSR